jgi:hypothetical protein
MAIEGTEFSGVLLRAVSVRELKQHYPKVSDPSTSGAPIFTPSSVRFGTKKKRGRGR